MSGGCCCCGAAALYCDVQGGEQHSTAVGAGCCAARGGKHVAGCGLWGCSVAAGGEQGTRCIPAQVIVSFPVAHSLIPPHNETVWDSIQGAMPLSTPLCWINGLDPHIQNTAVAPPLIAVVCLSLTEKGLHMPLLYLLAQSLKLDPVCSHARVSRRRSRLASRIVLGADPSSSSNPHDVPGMLAATSMLSTWLCTLFMDQQIYMLVRGGEIIVSEHYAETKKKVFNIALKSSLAIFTVFIYELYYI